MLICLHCGLPNRNFLKSEEADYAVLSEYCSFSAVTRARALFFQRRAKLLLYTERAHFYHRYRIRGIQVSGASAAVAAAAQAAVADAALAVGGAAAYTLPCLASNPFVLKSSPVMPAFVPVGAGNDDFPEPAEQYTLPQAFSPSLCAVKSGLPLLAFCWWVCLPCVGAMLAVHLLWP